MKIQAAARLATIMAADANDAGKIVMWIEKATGAKGKKFGKPGKSEQVEFNIKAGKDTVSIGITLDHDYNPPMLMLEGSCSFCDEEWYAEEATGRKTILKFKQALKDSIAEIENEEGAANTVAVLKKLLAAKSKVE